jgi:hypothetical protein
MRGIAGLILTLFIALPTSRAVTLYDAAQNNYPEDQGWFFYGAEAGTTRSVSFGVLSFGTAAGVRGGWSNTVPIFNTLVNPSFPVLDRNAGFVLGMDLMIKSEEHQTNDRAGFSVILLGSDHRGVELGFWTDQIFAQTLSGTTFVHGESAVYNAGIARHYDLGIKGNNYELFADGASILSGTVKDYEPGDASPDPYGLNNYLFFGDDTSSALASIQLTKVTLVPEPAGACLLIGGMIVGIARRRN